MADKPNYELPTSQLDLKERLANGNASQRVLSTSDEYTKRQEQAGVEGRDFAVEGNDTSGYVGTDPIYQSYANETEQPLRSEEGPEADLEEVLLDGTVPGEPVKEEGDEQDDAASERQTPKGEPVKEEGGDEQDDAASERQTPKPAKKAAAPRHSSSD